MPKIKAVAEEKDEVATLVGGELDLNTEIAKQTPEVQAAITAGHIVPRINDVNRRVKADKNDKGVLYVKRYLQMIPTNYLGMAAIANGVETTWKKSVDKDGKDDSDFDGPCAVKDYFYGNDLGVKSKESQRLAVLVEGPDKAKQAAARNLAKAFNISEAEALKKIEAMGL